MVLTRSMATTNDVQGEEPPTTALDRQVRTLAAAVERLTKQNNDLEEQLRQKNAGPNDLQGDQEGTSVARRNQERVEASHAPTGTCTNEPTSSSTCISTELLRGEGRTMHTLCIEVI